jgi:hypothetical protein
VHSRRLITSTPLQALVLLNDPTYVKPPALSRSSLLEAPSDFASRAASCSARPRRGAPQAELRVLLDLAQRDWSTTRKTPAQAAKLITIGASKPANVEAVELAAWTTVASTILNLDETITKE